jgi:uncharacterized damage-inducible protein DinB
VNPRLVPVSNSLKLGTAVLHRALADVDQATAETRPNEHTNSLAFVACHLLDSRFYLLRLVGGKAENPYAELFDAARTIEQMTGYPDMTELQGVWDDVDRHLQARLAELADEDLDAEYPSGFPTDDSSLLGVIGFLAFHEGYHVGQLGLLRKHFGMSPVVERPA